MKLTELYPSLPLCNYVSRYWSWREEENLPPLLPGCGGELFFYQRPVSLIKSNVDCATQPGCVLLLPRHGAFQFQLREPTSFIAVRFRTGALRHFSQMPEALMTDTCLSPLEIWGRRAAELEERLCEAPDATAQVVLLESFLLEQLALNKKTSHMWLDEAVRRMYYQYQNITLDELIALSGFGTRYFQKLFNNHFGIAPRHFQRIIRFEQLIRYLLLNRQRDYLHAALEHGYYDQSHFIKDFRFFIDEVPSEFLQERNFCSHFYNTPSPGPLS